MKRWVPALGAAVVLAALATLTWWPRGETQLAAVAPLALTGSACGAVASTSEPPRTLELVAYRGSDVSGSRVREQLGKLAGYYAPYGVHLQLRGPMRELGVGHVIEGDRVAIDRALVKAGIEPSRPASDPARARQVVCQVALAPLRRLLADQRSDGGDAHVVVLATIAPVESMVAKMLPDLRGLTVSPRMHDAELQACLGAEQPFVPTVMLGLDAIGRRAPGTLDVTLAHELGHVLGLEHSSAPNDLMAVQPPTCVPVLSEAQRAVLFR